MEEDKQEFKRNLDELIKLFRKLKNKTSIENMPGVDKAMVQNFEVFLSNYDNMKDHITDDLFDQFGVPMRQMIADLVSQLKSELSQEEISEFENLTEIEKTDDVDNFRDINEIDKLLKNPKLSQEEIDKLLDERSSLKK
jgi:hypothetical protein